MLATDWTFYFCQTKSSQQLLFFFLNDFIGFVPLKIEWSDEIEPCFVQIRLLLLFVFWSVSHFSLAKRLFLFCGFNLQSCQQHGRHQHFKSQLSLEFSSKKSKSQKYFNLSFHLSINIVGGKCLEGFYSFFTHKQHIHIFIIWLPVSLFCEFFKLFFAWSYFFKLSSFHVFVFSLCSFLS